MVAVGSNSSKLFTKSESCLHWRANPNPMKTYYYAGLAAISIACFTSCSEAGSSEAADNKKAAEALEHAFEKGDCDSVAAFFADDAVIHQEAPEFAVNKEGKALMVEVCGLYHAAFPDISYDIKHVIGEGDLVAVWLEASGTNSGALGPLPASGKHVSGIASVDIFRFKDGKVVEQWGVFDEMGMIEQVGWMEQPTDTSSAPQ